MVSSKKIFNSYLKTNKSIYHLAKDFDISPQRVQKIITNCCLDNMLNVSDNKKVRERVKNNAIILREKGSLYLSKNLFESVLEWDKTHNNYRGFIDVVGHLRIVYTLLAKRAKSTSSKKAYLQKAQSLMREVLRKPSDNIPQHSINILKVHYASLLTNLALLTTSKKERESLLKKAISTLKSTIKDFPGSKAHLAWPLGNLAKNYYLLGEYDKAFYTAHLAEEKIYDGYLKEFYKDSQDATIKFNVWLSKAVLLKALACKQTKKDLLSKYYARSVLSLKGPAYLLKDVRKEARELI